MKEKIIAAIKLIYVNLVERKYVLMVVSSVVFVASITWYAFFPPVHFPAGRIIEIEKGSTVSEIASMLKEKKLIHSEKAFAAVVRFASDDTRVLAGDYFFEYPLTVVSMAKRLTQGEFGIDPLQITIHEGSSIDGVAETFATQFTDFDAENFLMLAEGKEGYLFPDTYLFLPNVEEEQVLREMEENFNRRIASIQDKIDEVDMELSEIITLASIIEREAWKKKDQHLISGVLYNRLEINMPLQVDATFAYVNGKNTYELTYDDLAIDSPYNTYKYKGLPPGPIANPGLGAIEAAIEPEANPYFFYLADREGNTYYAETYDGHLRNKSLYMN